MPKPVLAALAVEPEEQEASYSFSTCGKELFFRAFLFRNGTLLMKDGSVPDVSVIRQEDIDWDTKKLVGRGVSGSVYFVKEKNTGRPLAVKSIQITTKTHRDEVNAELSILTSPGATNHVVKTYGAFWEPGDNSVAIVMEWMSFSLYDIHTFCRGLEESVVRDIALQLVVGAHHLHADRKVIHRDIKPKNVLVSGDGFVKLSDFGIAKVISTVNAGMMSYVGTEVYMAPERLDQGGYGFASDVWSIGLTLVSCATGQSPWPSELTVFALVMKMKNGEVPSFPSKFSDDAKDFLSRCLAVDPDARPSCADLLEHPFLRGHTVEAACASLTQLLPVISELANNSYEQQQKIEVDRAAKAKQMLEDSGLPMEDD